MIFGRLYREDSAYTKDLTKGSLYINAISNHLSASSPRAQFLGMIVGNTVSSMVDTQEKRLEFDMEELKGIEGTEYRALISIRDSIGRIEDIATALTNDTPPKKSRKSHLPKQVVQKAENSKVMSIEEIEEDSNSDDDLPIFVKPDSDKEDEDDDPTLIQRNKASAPVSVSNPHALTFAESHQIYSRSSHWSSRHGKLRPLPHRPDLCRRINPA